MKRIISILPISVFCLVFVSGCVTSPIDSGAQSSALSPGSLVAMAVGGGAGGLIGNQIAPGGLGAAVGTGVGMIGAAALVQASAQYNARQKAEAYERGKRSARVEVMEQYWYDQTSSYDPKAGKSADSSRPTRDIKYDAGVYEGVKLDQNFRPVPVGPYEPVRTDTSAVNAPLQTTLTGQRE